MNDDVNAGDGDLLRTAQLYLRACYAEGETPTSLSKLTGLSRASLWRLDQGVLRPRLATVCLLRLAYREAKRRALVKTPSPERNWIPATRVPGCARRRSGYGRTPGTA